MNYEEYLFNKFKDVVIYRKKFMDECEKFSGVNGENVYKRIIEYQIKRYHTQLRDFGNDNYNSELFIRRNRAAKQRRQHNGIRKRGIDD